MENIESKTNELSRKSVFRVLLANSKLLRLLNIVLVLFVLCPTVIAEDENKFPKTFSIGDLAINVEYNGVIFLKYKDSALLAVQSVWFMNEKWRILQRKENDLLSVELLSRNEFSCNIKIKDIRADFLKNFDEQLLLTKNSLDVIVDYEYSADIGQWHWPVYLFAQYFAGMKYKSVLADGRIKDGVIPEVMPGRIIRGFDGNLNLKEITFFLKDVDLKFTFFETGWNFCDYRDAAWMKTKVFMLLNSNSTKQKDSKEHYALKISIVPRK